MLRDLSITEFTKVLSKENPTPGGGAAAALSAALAASLTSMVFNLTIDKKTEESYDEATKTSLRNSLEATNRFRIRFLELMAQDAYAFDELMDSYKLPKDNDIEKSVRSKKIVEAKKKVLEAPWMLVEEAYDMYHILRIATEYGNKNAISDAGVAAILLHSAIEGAALNVYINLANSEVSEKHIQLKKKTDELVEKSRGQKEDIVAITTDKIYGRA